MVELEEDILEFLQLLGIAAVAAHLSDFLADGEHAIELSLQVFPERVAYMGELGDLGNVTMVLSDEELVGVDYRDDLGVAEVGTDHL